MDNLRSPQRLGCARRYDIYSYAGMNFRLSNSKCDNLRESDRLAALFRQLYIAEYQKGRRSIGGFLRDVQNASLWVLREFDRICKARGLVYMLHGGALLGAWRHAGFIPWDDDIDVIMPREHYEKIIDAFNADCRISSLRAILVSPSRGAVFIKIEMVGEPMIFLDVFPYDCYADTLDQALRRRLEECLDGIAGKVLPGGSPIAKYEYYAGVRNSLGLTKVSHDDPKCQAVLCLFECHNGRFFSFETVFPIGSIDFEGLSVPAPENTTAMLRALYWEYEAFPLSSRVHSNVNEPTIARMLNVKRFLRSDSFCLPLQSPDSVDDGERWRDRFITFVRNMLAPVFTVITHDTLKEYRIFSRKKIFRLRVDRVIRGRLEMVESYHRLLWHKQEFPLAQGGTRQSQLAAVDALARVFRVCDSEGLSCWLWLGSLLGAIRNGTFLPGDEEAVLLMPRADYERFRLLFNTAPDTGGLLAELLQRHGGLATVVSQGGMGRVVIIPCDFCPDDWDRDTYYARRMADAANQTAVNRLKAENNIEGLYQWYAAEREHMGIGLKGDSAHSLFPGWDCPDLFKQSHVLSAKYYSPTAKWTFEGIECRIPADHDMILTALYGDYMYHV